AMDGKAATVVREVVPVNHLRNCLLCDAPADPAKAPALSGVPYGIDDVKTGRRGPRVQGRPIAARAAGRPAPVPLPGQALRQLTGRDAEPTAAAWRKLLAEK